MQNIWKEIRKILKEFFDLEADRDSYATIIENISKGIEFRGTNLFILIFAIIIASVGLNMNAAAVVIGAMLISPLMGPIMGIGLGVGIYDFQLIKRSFKNILTAVVISIITSALYFSITPINDAQSELLARTTPTIWDVFIAFFGGLAGIVAATRKDKSNAIPGVAIATALMPPLCTAGYGIATLNATYFLGALYLFFINSVFISVASILIIRFMRFPAKEWVDAEKQKRVKSYVLAVTLVTLIPSIYLAYGIVKRSIFTRNASEFISQEMDYENSRIIEQTISPIPRKIEIFLYGSPISDEEIKRLQKDLTSYNIGDAELIIHQNQQTLPDADKVKTGILEDLYVKNEETIKNKDLKIELLEKELTRYKEIEVIQSDVCKELEIQYPTITACAINTMTLVKANNKLDTLTMVIIDSKQKLPKTETDKITKWLSLRVKRDNIRIIQQ